jgi:membrane protein implicated in regulation of membrane protease activity
MHIIAIAWVFVVVMMALAEVTSTEGTALGAIFTLLLYGALPLSIVLYVMGTPMRRRAREKQEMIQAKISTDDSANPDDRRVPTGDAVAPEGKEP